MILDGGLVAGPVVPSFRALSGRLKSTARRHKFNTDYLSQVRYGSAFEVVREELLGASDWEQVPSPTLEVTQGQILSQSPTDATSLR